MPLQIRALALSAAIFWGAMFFLIGLGHLVWGYGEPFLLLMASLYPGYTCGGGIVSVLVGTLYAVLDGLVAGAVLAWLYNRLRRAPKAA